MPDRSLSAMLLMETSAEADDQLIEEEIAVGEVYLYRAGNGELVQVHVMGVYQATILNTEELLETDD